MGIRHNRRYIRALAMGKSLGVAAWAAIALIVLHSVNAAVLILFIGILCGLAVRR